MKHTANTATVTIRVNLVDMAAGAMLFVHQMKRVPESRNELFNFCLAFIAANNIDEDSLPSSPKEATRLLEASGLFNKSKESRFDREVLASIQHKDAPKVDLKSFTAALKQGKNIEGALDKALQLLDENAPLKGEKGTPTDV